MTRQAARSGRDDQHRDARERSGLDGDSRALPVGGGGSAVRYVVVVCGGWSGGEDRPTDLGAPLGLVTGVVAIDRVELADRAGDTDRVAGDVGGEIAVGAVNSGFGAVVRDNCEVDCGQFSQTDPSGRIDWRDCWQVDGGLAAVGLE